MKNRITIISTYMVILFIHYHHLYVVVHIHVKFHVYKFHQLVTAWSAVRSWSCTSLSVPWFWVPYKLSLIKHTVCIPLYSLGSEVNSLNIISVFLNLKFSFQSTRFSAHFFLPSWAGQSDHFYKSETLHSICNFRSHQQTVGTKKLTSIPIKCKSPTEKNYRTKYLP